MPLDGTHYDEATQQLRDAKKTLIDKGWCVGERENWKGEHCALGALDVVIGEMATGRHLAVRRLAAAIPGIQLGTSSADWDVAEFNNSQGGVDSIIEWFDRALA